MISLDSIFENIVAEIFGIILSLLISYFGVDVLGKKKTTKKFDTLKISIFFTLVFVFNLILNLSFWNNSQWTIFLTLGSLGGFLLSGYIYSHQCPSCKKFIHAKKKIDDKVIKEFKRAYKYQPFKVFLYSNGNIWKKEPVGRELTRDENWITKQEFYECNHCNYRWDSGLFDMNLDEETRPNPKLETINTNEKDPNEMNFS